MSHKTLRMVLVGVLISILITSCAGAAAPAPTNTPTIDPATPAAATAAVETARAEAAEATVSAKSTAEAQAAIDAQATADSQATAEAIAQMTATQDAKNAKATADMAAKQTKTAEAVAQKTAQAQPMYDLVQKLVADGYLESGEGNFQLLPDFSESVAKINYIRWFPTDISPKWFIIRTNLAWESASETANWFSSACGFIFHIGSDQSFYYANLNLEGRVEIGRHRPNFSYVEKMVGGFYGEVDIPEGNVTFAMLVAPNQITVFVNDKKVASYQTELKYTSGDLSYSITSGTNKDFGTRCTLSNVELWVLK